MSAPTPVRTAWTRLSTWMAAYERPVGPPMPGVIPSTLAADRAVVEAWVMAEPAGDVAAAVEALSHYVEDGWSIAAPGHSTVEHRIHARWALALLAQALTDREMLLSDYERQLSDKDAAIGEIGRAHV